MDFELTEDQVMLRDTVRRFVDDRVIPEAAAWDRDEAFAPSMVEQLAEMGLLGIAVAEQHGGAGMGPMESVLVLEELARGDGGLAYAVAAHGACCAHLGHFPDAASWLGPLALGEQLGGWVCAGSQRPASPLRGRLEGEVWVLDGTVEFVPMGSLAGVLVIVATTGDGDDELTAFVVDAAAEVPGLSRRKQRGRLGLRSGDCATLVFDGVRLADAKRLGEPGHARPAADAIWDLIRLQMAAIAAGVARGALDAASSYALERQQFGRPIGDFQAIQWRLADSAVDLEAGRALTLNAASLAAAGESFGDAAAKAKLSMGRAAVRVADHAVQIFGGNGYTSEFPVERAYRDAAVCAAEHGNEQALSIEIANRSLDQIR